MKTIFGGIFFVLATLEIIVPAAAVTTAPVLADPTYAGNSQYGYWNGVQQVGSGNNPFVGEDIHLFGSSVSTASTDVWVDLNEPTLRVDGTASGDVVAVSVGQAILTYQFEVVGPTGLAPVGVKASGVIAGTGIFSSLLAQFRVGSVGGYIIDEDVQNIPGSWQVDGTYMFETNVPITVTMAVQGVSELNSGSGSYSASIDPIFSVDSSSGYELFFSRGIGNVPSAVPEPSTWAMMALGFLGLGLVARRTARGKENFASQPFCRAARTTLRTRICAGLASTALFATLLSTPVRAGSEASDAYQACASQYGSLGGRSGGRAMVIGYAGPDNMRCFFAWNSPSAGAAASFATRNCTNAGYAKCFLFATTEKSGRTRYDDWVASGRAQAEQFNAYEEQNQQVLNGLGDFFAGAALGAAAGLGAGAALDNRPAYHAPAYRYGGGSSTNCNWSAGACSTK